MDIEAGITRLRSKSYAVVRFFLNNMQTTTEYSGKSEKKAGH